MAESLGGILRELRGAAQGGSVSVGQMVGAIGPRATGPLLFVPALVAVTPVGAIPGAPAVLAAVIAAVALQGVFARDGVWLPRRLRRQAVSSDRLDAVLARAERWVRPIDRNVGGRLTLLTSEPARLVVTLLCVPLALAMIPLELVPFAAALPAGTILLLSVAMILRDGVVMLVALIAGAAAMGWAATLM